MMSGSIIVPSRILIQSAEPARIEARILGPTPVHAGCRDHRMMLSRQQQIQGSQESMQSFTSELSTGKGCKSFDPCRFVAEFPNALVCKGLRQCRNRKRNP